MLPVKGVPYNLLRSVRVYLRVLQKVGFPKYSIKKVLFASKSSANQMDNKPAIRKCLQLKLTNAIGLGESTCHRGSFWASPTKSWIFALAQAGINDAIFLQGSFKEVAHTFRIFQHDGCWWFLFCISLTSKNNCIECTYHMSDLCCIELRLAEDGWNHKKSWRSITARYTNHISKLYSRLVHVYWSEDTHLAICDLLGWANRLHAYSEIPGTLKFPVKSNFHQGSIICKGFSTPMHNWQELNALKFCYDFCLAWKTEA